MAEKIVIFDFGSQYTQLIARRVRELNVYCEIYPYHKSVSLDTDVKGIILSGGPSSVRDKDAPHIELNSFIGKVPVLGICYGAQFIAKQEGSEISPSKIREYGRAHLTSIDENSPLLKKISQNDQVWMSHSDSITTVTDSIDIIATTESIPVAAYQLKNKEVFGIQFHPEVVHSECGKQIIENFVKGICSCSGDWKPSSFVKDTVEEIKEKVGDEKVILGLSGGVDSSVAALLIHKAIGKQLTCIFVDNGLLRHNEFDEVLEDYKGLGLNVIGVNAKDKFYDALSGLEDPEAKRKAIGKVFVDVFDEESNKIENAKWLAQGTIYPDIIESVSVKGPSATIKSHHNVGGLPDYMKLKLLEPLTSLFKDEVRKVGKELGLPQNILGRHPFPGPGLGIRILGEVTPEKVNLLQLADHYFIQGLKNHGLYDDVWQAGVILLPVRSVGVMGDERTYENVVALRAVTSLDGMTADWIDFPHSFLAEISNTIINSVKGINRVVYDISSKPPATIEWE